METEGASDARSGGSLVGDCGQGFLHLLWLCRLGVLLDLVLAHDEPYLGPVEHPAAPDAGTSPGTGGVREATRVPSRTGIRRPTPLVVKALSLKKRRAAILRIATRALLSASRPSTWCGTCTAARKPRTRASPRRGAKSSKRGKRTVREPARRCASPFPSSSARRARRVFRAIFQRYGNGEWNTYDRLVRRVTMYC